MNWENLVQQFAELGFVLTIHEDLTGYILMHKSSGVHKSHGSSWEEPDKLYESLQTYLRGLTELDRIRREEGREPTFEELISADTGQRCARHIGSSLVNLNRINKTLYNTGEPWPKNVKDPVMNCNTCGVVLKSNEIPPTHYLEKHPIVECLGCSIKTREQKDQQSLVEALKTCSNNRESLKIIMGYKDWSKNGDAKRYGVIE